jgi:hypothetical protein
MACLGPAGCQVKYGAPGTFAIACDASLGAAAGLCVGGGACSLRGDALLDCDKGHWRSVADCLGPDGCKVGPDRQVRCDGSRDRPGGSCSGDGNVCSVDGKAMLRCENGAFVASRRCENDGGCQISGRQLICGQETAGVGEPCEGEGAVCSSDRRAVLGCKSGHFAIDRRCLDPRRCSIVGDMVGCR